MVGSLCHCVCPNILFTEKINYLDKYFREDFKNLSREILILVHMCYTLLALPTNHKLN